MADKNLILALACSLSLSSSAAVGAPRRSVTSCAAWVGRYVGVIPKEESAFEDGQRVIVIVQLRSTYVAITGDEDDRGAFEASGVLRCTSNRASGKLDTGAAGSGKISVAFQRKRAAVYLRLYGYNEGDGFKNQASYLPRESYQIALKRRR